MTTNRFPPGYNYDEDMCMDVGQYKPNHEQTSDDSQRTEATSAEQAPRLPRSDDR